MTSKMFRASVKIKADEAAGRWRLSITLEKCHPPPGPAAAAVGTRSAAPGREAEEQRRRAVETAPLDRRPRREERPELRRVAQPDLRTH